MVESERGLWQNKRQFLLACVGYAVGLGNVWRFPYLCFKSGGGAFLLPYFITLLVCAIPLLYLEMAVGQYTRYGPVHAFGLLCPLFKGVGMATVVISFMLCTYYNVIISWAIYYLFNTFRSTLPWYSCNQSWSSVNCTELTSNPSNLTSNFSVSATQDFFDRIVLGKTDGIHNMGSMQWEVFGCFVLAWVLCYLCVFKGIKSAGKVVYFTATFPYLILITLFFASVSLPGSVNGIIYFLRPVWHKLLDVEVWINAAAQNFNSIGIGFGSLIAFSSYNPRNNNILRDTLCIAGINSITSILAGFVIFSAMGHMSHILNRPVDEVATGGPELVFIVYPQIFANLPLPALWAAIFFIMLICLGIDSQFAMIEVVNTTLGDAFQGKLLKKFFKRKEVLAASVCVIAFLIGIPNLMQGGIYVFTLMDNYTAIVSLMFLAFFEVISLCWVYGGRKVAENVYEMTGSRPPRYFVFCWLVCSPLLITIILIFSVVQYKPARYGDYSYPVWADGLGWLVSLSSLLCIPVCAVISLLQREGSFVERFFDSIKPTLPMKGKGDEMVSMQDISSSSEEKPPPFYSSASSSPFLGSGDIGVVSEI